jgi:hypothetical protein
VGNAVPHRLLQGQRAGPGYAYPELYCAVFAEDPAALIREYVRRSPGRPDRLLGQG